MDALKNFVMFTRKHLCWSLLELKLKGCNFIKRRLQHRCFPGNIAKFLRTVFLVTAIKVFQEVTASKFQGQHGAQFNFCRYESESS